jgi:PAS domain S-box-containing protein
MSDASQPDAGPRLFEEMVETVGVGVAIYGADGRYRYVNDAYASILGADREELVGTELSDVVVDIDPDRFEEYWSSFSEGETRVAEAEHEWDGDRVPVSTVTTCRHIDGVPYHFGTVRDISERREREAELRVKNERLEAFAGIVSHDLRNPLGVAKGYLDLVEEETGELEELELLGSALERMEMLVDDLLALAQEGHAVTDVQPVSVEHAAEEAWANVRTAGSTLVTESVGTVAADPSRFQQLLENLFRNAVEHGTPGEGPPDDGEGVTVTVGPLERGFYVADDGTGVPQTVAERAFEPGVTDSETGTGFGLAIVGEVAADHGWTVEATESEHGGARFEFRTDPEDEAGPVTRDGDGQGR